MTNIIMYGLGTIAVLGVILAVCCLWEKRAEKKRSGKRLVKSSKGKYIISGRDCKW